MFGLGGGGEDDGEAVGGTPLRPGQSHLHVTARRPPAPRPWVSPAPTFLGPPTRPPSHRGSASAGPALGSLRAVLAACVVEAPATGRCLDVAGRRRLVRARLVRLLSSRRRNKVYLGRDKV